MELAECVFRATSELPYPHRQELGRQMRRASVSIASNVAEGFRQGSRGAYTRHVRIAAGSAAELETQAELATTLRLWPPATGAQVRELAARCGQMLTRLAASLELSGPARPLTVGTLANRRRPKAD